MAEKYFGIKEILEDHYSLTEDEGYHLICGILTESQINWFYTVHVHVYEPWAENGLEMLKETNFNYPEDESKMDARNLYVFLLICTQQHSGFIRQIDFILGLIAYCKNHRDDIDEFEEGQFIFFSDKYNCYYCKPLISSPSLDDLNIGLKDEAEKFGYICSDTISDVNEKFWTALPTSEAVQLIDITEVENDESESEYISNRDDSINNSELSNGDTSKTKQSLLDKALDKIVDRFF